MTSSSSTEILWFESDQSISTLDVGGKGISLSKMAKASLPVPPGFTIATRVFKDFLEESQLKDFILSILHKQDPSDNHALEAAALKIKEAIMQQELSASLSKALQDAYKTLSQGKDAFVAVRSSATAEDSAEASFAGQQDTYLNVKGVDELSEKVKACWASFFGGRALFYRSQKGSLEDLSMAVVVQRMIAPEKSGVMFTVDPVMKNQAQMMIEAAWGLGEAVVSGMVTPDNYMMERSSSSISRKMIAPKAFAMVRDEEHGGVIEIELDEEKQRAQVLNEEELSNLVALGETLEQHFGSPQDVEWGIENGKIFLLQSRPITSL